MTTLKYIFSILIAAAGLSSCVGDLNVKPIDPSMNLEEDALKTADDYFDLLSSCYVGFATSGATGAGSSTISGLDPGASQYYRGRYYLNALTTDEAVCGWDDQTIQDFHSFAWTTEDVFVAAFYYRIFYQIAVCNNFIRMVNKAEIELPDAAQWVAEAKTLRALCWFDAIDNFGNVPFADETVEVGMTAPKQISRADLFRYIETELKALIEGDDLPEIHQGGYGRADKGMAVMILAKLYLNAEVYTGEDRYQDCADVLHLLEGKYAIHNTVHGTGTNPYIEMFLADNDQCGEDEFIWAVIQDGINTQSYGATNFIIFASTGGDMNASSLGISGGWSGLRTTPQMYDKFSSNDLRRLFYDKEAQQAWWEEQYMEYEAGVSSSETLLSYKDWVKKNEKVEQKKEIGSISDFTNGYAFMKFRNVQSNEDAAQAKGYVDVDYPVFRYADALLMLAECEARGAALKGMSGLEALNAVRSRAGLDALSAYTKEEVLDERARELYQEGWRRNDLIRYGLFTSDKYRWAWKGGVKDGQGVDSHLNLFPIPQNDRNANPNLQQNTGY